MNFMSSLNAATMGNPKRLRAMVLWTILEYMFRGMLHGFSLLIVWEIFKPLQNPGLTVDYQTLIWTCLGLFIALIFLFIISKKGYNKMYFEAYEICSEGRMTIGDHIRKLSMGFFNSRDPGTIGSYLINDYANIEFMITHFVPQFIGALVMPLVLIMMLAFFDWRMALIAIAVIPLAIPFALLAGWIVRHFGKKHLKSKTDASSRMLEYLEGMKLIKSFNLVGTKFDRLEKAFKLFKKHSIQVEASGGPTIIIAGFILHGGLSLIIIAGLHFMFNGTLTLPFYIMFLILGQRIYEPLMQALMFFGELNYFQLSIERIEDLRKTPTLTGTDPALTPDRFDIEFDQVSFRYHDKNVIENVSFQIPEHSLIAFVGPSGSGKTTLTRLIARFWDVTDGSIRLDGHDIREYDPDELIKHISMVFQDVYLFNDTVLNNIRIGNRNATTEEVIQAATKARCHEFIEKLPDGYDSEVGEGGCTLSGGEKQRISIARAILKNTPIVLLDEATASLDPENELYIQQAIDDLVKEKTVVVIAHRLNTVVHADKIIVLDEGKIIQQGKHLELMQTDGLYKRMWDEQQKTRGWKFR